jgi:uncharacterized protein with GYD domain
MSTYIMLLNYTQQGHQKVLEAPQRTDAVKVQFEKLGANLRECFAVMGQHDEIAIVEAPNELVASQAAHALCSQGNVSVQTLRAFTQEEHREILAASVTR